MKIFINIIRIIVGLLFIFSGLIKANDPLGLSYKMQEFFEVWNFNFLNTYAFYFSIIIITFEVLAGVAVLIGWKKKLFLYLLLLLTIFFGFLTGYALFSGKIKTCGCFGDCIPLTAQQSFIKDLILLILVSFLFIYQKYIQSICKPLISIIVLIFSIGSTLFLQWYVLQHLPILDCLPYKKGNNLLTLMQPSTHTIQENSVITFVYNKNGKEIEFTADQFPKDFNDTIYHFVRRYDKIIHPENILSPIADFALMSSFDGNDSTKTILNYKGNLLILFTQNIENADIWINDIKEINTMLRNRSNWMFIIATSDVEKLKNTINQLHIPISIFVCDATVIKTIARVKPTLYLLQQGKVIEKWGYIDFDKAIKNIKIQLH